MIEDIGKRKLGRGLSALLGDDDAADMASLERIRSGKLVPIGQIRPNANQPRRRFEEESLQGLVESIREKGILQPILVRRIANEEDVYEIVAGERRWRAAQRAEVHEVPVVIRDLSDADTLEIALIENIQREDLSPVEEARGYHALIESFKYTQEQLSKGLGKSRSHVANMLRLLSLPDSVLALVDEGKISAGAARAIITADDPEGLARQIVAKGLNVRQVEKLAEGHKPKAPRKPRPQKDSDTAALEGDLSATLGMKVTLEHRGMAGGLLTIHYETLEDLDEICRRLSRHIDYRNDGGSYEEEALGDIDPTAAIAADLADLDDKSDH
ncbi:ParB/RepB/Spo0J family partition protein [Oceanibacterium hippocampi]|uniref:Chromosome-partitioning protein ParB n=1 Tax=Oceanibacterium hippocampi TaxID=745714 RepID=A0A1Y5RLZ8_9PROT|nr:ParB/RepB/Spo0J family partition protein [Oceanibacterium hippocampi]SLN20452.1 Chromosome-partitioning protein ParB [Oceanibacterium hippocampi]